MAHAEDTPMVSRRALLKASAGAGAAGVAATGGGGIVPKEIQPVGDAQAGLVTGTVLISVGAMAGATVVSWASDSNSKVDSDDVLEDQIYSIASGVSDGRDEFEDEMQTQFIDRANDQTPYANAAWGEVRAAAAKTIANGGSESEALQAANDALNQQTTISMVNAIERWNTAIDALTEAVTIQSENELSVLEASGDSSTNTIQGVTSSDIGSFGTWTPVEASNDGSDNYVVWESDSLDLPAQPSNIEGLDEIPSIYGVSYPGAFVIAPHPGYFATDGHSSSALLVEASHPELSTQTVLDCNIYSDMLDAITAEYQNITDQLDTYVNNLYNAITEGAIDPADIYSPRDMVREFDNSDQMDRAAAELIAVGATAPDDLGYQAEISHPDLASDSLWGWLYPQFGSGDPIDITPGTTLAAADYELAYFGYESAVDGSFNTRVLSGESELQILAVENVEGQETLDSESHGTTAGTDGRVTVWDGENPPEPIANPADHSGWQVLVHSSGETTSQHPIGDLQTDGTEHYLATTDLAEGDAIEAVEVVPSVEYSQTVTHVADPTTVGGEETVNQLEAMRDTVENLKEELGNDGGGGMPLPGIGDIANVGGIAGLVVLGILAAIFWPNRGSN